MGLIIIHPGLTVFQSSIHHAGGRSQPLTLFDENNCLFYLFYYFFSFDTPSYKIIEKSSYTLKYLLINIYQTEYPL